MNRDSILLLVYAVATAALSICTARGYVTADDSVAVSGVLVAFATAYHIPNAKAAEALREAKAPVGEHADPAE